MPSDGLLAFWHFFVSLLKATFFLHEEFPLLQAGVRKFQPHVPIYKRWRFERAWRLYHVGVHGEGYWQYTPHSGESVEKGKWYKHDNTLTCRNDFKRNVDRLLGYEQFT